MSDDGRAYGVLAEFETPGQLVEAVRRARRAGYRRLDAYSPFPVEGLSQLLGYRAAFLPLLAVAAALVGGGLMYATQYWMNAVDYPLNVGGRPLHSWPTSIPETVIVGILWAAVAAVLGLLAFNRLPELHHPVFNAPGFERASQDRFFLCLRADDPTFVESRAVGFLRGLRAREVVVLPW